MIFNNADPNTNGEILFYNKIKSKICVIFDVGCRTDSLFTNFHGEVHYFDPVPEFIQELSNKNNSNSKSYFNSFGLGNENGHTFYYPKYQSFLNRTNSCKISDENNKIILNITKSKDYVLNNNIKIIDFIKIDTEGYELNVLMGFEELLELVKIIQFEYGGTFLDNNVKLKDIVLYLKKYGFDDFSYLSTNGTEKILNFDDHYQYCNIVCFNKNSKISI